MPQTREHILAREASGRAVFVGALNKVDNGGHPELLELVELEVRELLTFSDLRARSAGDSRERTGPR